MEHKKLNPEMSLTAFLKTHYDHPVKDSDYDKDQRLPFVSHGNLLSVVFTISPALDFHCTEKTGRPTEISPVFYKNVFHHKEIVNSIWEPPKFHQS